MKKSPYEMTMKELKGRITEKAEDISSLRLRSSPLKTNLPSGIGSRDPTSIRSLGRSGISSIFFLKRKTNIAQETLYVLANC
jgi:hypothetical protein